jgi:hypothetical protein
MDSGAAAGGVFFLIMMVVITLISVASLGLTIYALIDILKVPDDSHFQTGNKLIWILVVVLIGCIGPIIYLAVGKPKGPRT